MFAYLKIPEVELLALRRLLLIKETKSSLKISIFSVFVPPTFLPCTAMYALKLLWKPHSCCAAHA